MEFIHETTEVKISVRIELKDITEETYRDIISYIEKRTGRGTRETRRTEKAEKTEKAESNNDISDKKEEPESDVKAKRLEEQKRVEAAKQALSNIVNDLRCDYANRPSLYKIESFTANEIIERYPSLKGSSPIFIGKLLNKMRVPSKRGGRWFPSGKWGPVTLYDIPVLQNAPTSVGNAIQTARQNERLNRKELADLIGYPVDVVRKWEQGELIPSSEGRAKLIEALGADLFNNVGVAI